MENKKFHLQVMPLFKGKVLFYLVSLLVTCSLWGQDSKFINGHLEKDKVYFEIKKELLDTPMLFVRHDIGYHQVVWSKQGEYLLLTIISTQSSSGVLIPLHYVYKNELDLIGRFPIIKDKSS